MKNCLFIEYPKCSTCQKAKKWLEENGISFMDRHIVENCPTVEELRGWHKRSGLPLKSFFNTSGLSYKRLELKDKLSSLSEDKQYRLLASDGMLIKRPLLICEDKAFVGFKPEKWQAVK